MTVREKVELALDREVTLIDATARDNGHEPEAWESEEPGVAHTRCGRCGQTAVVRVTAQRAGDVSVWRAGHLRRSSCEGSSSRGGAFVGAAAEARAACGILGAIAATSWQAGAYASAVVAGAVLAMLVLLDGGFR